MRWLPPGFPPARALAIRPPECLVRPSDTDAAYRVELGRAAFRTPLLLGGQAARAGVSCETCHQNGRSNPHFDFPGVSGAPGTADVTSSLFSSHRGDGTDNPKPIPDLGGPKDRLKVAQAPQGRKLEAFIRGLVVEEFDGPEPPPAVLDGLAAYVRAMSPAACAARPEPVRLRGDVDEARRAVRAALAALDHQDPAAAALMVEAARTRLGLMHERYAGFEAEQRQVRLADLDLAGALAAIRARAPAAAQGLTAWLAGSTAWEAALARAERRSLYDPARLARLAPAR